MSRNAFHPTADSLPPTLPIFPLPGALVLPDTHLPLNIFEPRYVNMTLDALKGHRMIGMIQPSDESAVGPPGEPPVYTVGAAGRITSFSETEDGRLLINLYGVARFRVREQLPNVRGYRRVVVDWSEFLSDLQPVPACRADREPLQSLLRAYFDLHGLKADWQTIEKTPLSLLVNTLTMVCPFPSNEKQALLEADTVDARAAMMSTLMEMALRDIGQGDKPAN
jgi:uncharacterized protein